MPVLTRFFAFLTPIVLLVFLSLLILHSVDAKSADQQLVFAVLGVILFVVVSRIDYQLYLFSPWPWYFSSLFFLTITLLLTDPVRGSHRWINILGFSLQTSEIVKPMLILFVASYLAFNYPKKVKDLLRFLAIMVVPFGLVFLQPDLGSALILAIIGAAGLLASGIPFKYLISVALIAILIVPIMFQFLKPYQINRLNTFLNPSTDPLGTGYNAVQATIAVGSGKIVGRGLGQGTQSHLRFLPERQTDFIFASLVEELGLLGGGLLILSYFWLSCMLLYTARVANSDTGSIICLISAALILFQFVVNVGMNMGVMPITGITLPFISAGGSSLVSFLIIMGICFSVLRHSRGKPASLEIH